MIRIITVIVENIENKVITYRTLSSAFIKLIVLKTKPNI